MQAQAEKTSLKAHELDVLKAKIKDIQIAMMTTQEPDGDFHTRPMRTHQIDEEGAMWFFSYEDSNKVNELRQNPRVGLGFADTGSETYVSTSGMAEVVNDRAKINELWEDGLKAWFPNGKDDPNICLIRVTTHAGEYWDRPGGKMMTFVEMVKGAVTGDTDKTGRNEKFGDEPR